MIMLPTMNMTKGYNPGTPGLMVIIILLIKTERFQAVQESAQYREVELVQTIGGQRKCFYSEFHALSDHQKTVF